MDRLESDGTASAASSEARLEIGHVLFIDIVGYSKRLVNEQTTLVKRLNKLVRATEHFQRAEADGKLITIPTGDGMALVFFTTPDAPVRCAIEINQADQEDPKIELRMGIHSGPVDRVDDVNERTNVAGTGINTAQRVMDCGDAGHILLSQRIAEDLAQYERWGPMLHSLGEFEVKHGARLTLFNLFSDTIGNPNIPEKRKTMENARRIADRVQRRHVSRKRLALAGIAIVLLAGLLAFSYRFLIQRAEKMVRAREPEIPAKSVAVLPFENLSPDQANAYLAGGLQDEVITQLSKISDLKVISRTSTMQYGSKPGNLRQIAKELAVAAILEGSVQKVANQIRVNVQLIKAATDAHLWAETYDRELIDLLKAQSEIAQRVALELNTTLSTEEKARIEEKVTTNPEAYALYLKGTEVLRRPAVAAERMEEGIRYFDQAIALDPKFALAHARLGQLHTRLAMFFDPSTFHKERGRIEPEEALRLQPNLSEAHIALGLYNGRLMLEFGPALREYELAKQGAPNDIQISYGIGWVQMKSGHWKAAIASFERAVSLDPMNWNLYDNLGNAYSAVGLKPAAERAKRRSAELATGTEIDKFAESQSWGWAYYDLTGSLEKLEDLLARSQALDDSTGQVAQSTFAVAMIGRDWDRAKRAIEKTPAAIFETFTGPRSTKKFLLGCVELARGDEEKARPLFEAELPFARSEVAEVPDSAARHAQLGLICAYLGQKEEAITEGERAAQLLPIEKDATDGPGIVFVLAEIYGRTGETDKAVALIEKLLSTPNGINQLFLKDWNWDPLRNHPRFQKLVNGPPPKIIYE